MPLLADIPIMLMREAFVAKTLPRRSLLLFTDGAQKTCPFLPFTLPETPLNTIRT